MFFWILKKRKKRTYSFTGHLITQLPKVSTCKSPTSNILLRNADTINYATCVLNSYIPIITMNFEYSPMAQNGSHSGN